MKTVLENKSDVEKVLKVIFEWDEVQKDYDKIVKKLRKQLKLDGFRPGKVPLSLAKRHLGPRIQYDFINKMVEKTFEDAIKQEDIGEYVGSSLEDVKFEENSPFEYHIKLEVDPKIELPDYKDGFTVKRKKYIVDDQDIDTYIDSVKKERAEVEVVDGEIESGHFVTLDLLNSDDKQEDVKWEVGSSPLDGDTEEKFLGKKAGDRFAVTLTIDDKDATEYDVVIKKVEKYNYPDINDEWVNENFETVETLDDWKKQIEESMKKEISGREKQEFEQNIRSWFADNMEVELPQARVDSYLDGMVKQVNQQQGGAQNIDENTIKQYYKPQAEESVRWFLIEEKIKEEEGLAVTSEDFDKKIEELLAPYPEDQREQFKNIYNQDNYKKQLEIQILSDKVFEHIQEFVNEDIEEVKTSELMKNNNA